MKDIKRVDMKDSQELKTGNRYTESKRYRYLKKIVMLTIK